MKNFIKKYLKKFSKDCSEKLIEGSSGDIPKHRIFFFQKFFKKFFKLLEVFGGKGKGNCFLNYSLKAFLKKNA